MKKERTLGQLFRIAKRASSTHTGRIDLVWMALMITCPPSLRGVREKLTHCTYGWDDGWLDSYPLDDMLRIILNHKEA